MSDWMRQVLESKRAMRKHLAALPIAEKLALLEKLRARTLAIRAARPAKSAPQTPSGSNSIRMRW